MPVKIWIFSLVKYYWNRMTLKVRTWIQFRVSLVVLCSFFVSNQLIAKDGKPIYNFDLLGFHVSKLQLHLNARTIALSEALFKKTKDSFFKSDSFTNKKSDSVYFSSGNVCLKVKNKKYTISWNNNETEGFWYEFEEMKKGEACRSELSKRDGIETPEIALSKLPMISDHFPQIQLGISTPQSIRGILGPPYCLGHFAQERYKHEIFYFLKRSLKAEKSCFGQVAEECYLDMKAIGVVFSFSQGVLIRITMFNDLAGEC